MLPSCCSVLVRVVVLLAVLPLWAPSAVSAQSYNPLVYPLTSCSSPTASLVTLGNATVSDPTDQVSYFQSTEFLLTAFDNTLFGAVLSQIAVPLDDNTNAGGAIHLRLGVYTVGQVVADTSNSLMSLVGQTADITLFPSGPQTLYADLLQPVQLLSGSQYALAVWADNGFNMYTSASTAAGYNADSANVFVGYSDYTFPSPITAYGPSTGSGYTAAIAATGCLDSASITAPGTAFYYMCAYTEQYAPSPSATDTSKVSTTTVLSVSGVVTVSTTPLSTVFGTGYAVLSFAGTLETQLSGQGGPDYITFLNSDVNLVRTNASSKLAGLTPSNLLYTTGAAAAVDANGLSFTASGGVQYVLQWNPAASQYQLLTSADGGAARFSPTMASSVTLTSITAASDPQFGCTSAQAQSYAPPTVPSCPSGYTSVYAGDLQGQQLQQYVQQTGIASGNVLYFRPFVAQVSGTLITSLSTYLLPLPGAVVHVRLGLYALNGSISSPSWTLVAAAAEQVIVNPSGGVVEVPLSPAVSVQPGTYAIGVWYDQPANAYIIGWPLTPSPSNLYQSYRSLSVTGQLPSIAVPQPDSQFVVAAAQTCYPNQQLLQFTFCSAEEDYNGGSYGFGGVLTTLATPLTNSFGSYYVVITASAYDFSYLWPNISIGAITNPAPQRLYIPSTTVGNVSLDSTGLQFVYNVFELFTYRVFSQPVPNTPTYRYQAVRQAPSGVSSVGISADSFSYTAGNTFSDAWQACAWAPPTYLNTLTPPPQPPAACTAVTALTVTLGDIVLADYAIQTEGRSVPGLTVYTNPFSVAISGFVVSQVVVDILDNRAQNVSVYMGVYSSTGALLATSALLLWQQVVDQQVLVGLTSPATLASGSYYAAIVTDVPLAIATSTTLSPSFAVSSLTVGLPATISLTAGSAGAVPLFVSGLRACYALDVCAGAVLHTCRAGWPSVDHIPIPGPAGGRCKR